MAGPVNTYSTPQPIAAADTNANVQKTQEAGAKSDQAFIGLAESGFKAAGGAAGGAKGGEGAGEAAEGAVANSTTNQTNNVTVNGSGNNVSASNAAATTSIAAHEH